MKKLIVIFSLFSLFTGCSTKHIIKRNNTISVEQQKTDANKEFKNLDKEFKDDTK